MNMFGGLLAFLGMYTGSAAKAAYDNYDMKKTTRTVDENGNVVAGNVIPLTIAFDHSAFDLGDVKPFMEKLNEIFLNPEVIKEWL